MRVCDRHPRKPAVGEIVITYTDAHYDLCEECLHKVEQFIQGKEKDIEPKKRSWGISKSA